jgi:hypothetical protein
VISEVKGIWKVKEISEVREISAGVIGKVKGIWGHWYLDGMVSHPVKTVSSIHPSFHLRGQSVSFLDIFSTIVDFQ